MKGPKASKLNDWQRFEDKVATQLRAMFPGAKITQNERIAGRYSKRKREVDIAIRQKAGPQELLIIVDCKCHKKTIDVKTMEAFCYLKHDVGAHSGMIVSTLGFSEAAVNVARDCLVSPYQYIEAEMAAFPKWLWVAVMFNVWQLIPIGLEYEKPDGSIEVLPWQNAVNLQGIDWKDFPVNEIVRAAWERETRDAEKHEGEHSVKTVFHNNGILADRSLVIRFTAVRKQFIRKAQLLFEGIAEKGAKAHAKNYILQLTTEPIQFSGEDLSFMDEAGMFIEASTTIVMSCKEVEHLLDIMLNELIRFEIDMSDIEEWKLPKLTESQLRTLLSKF